MQSAITTALLLGLKDVVLPLVTALLTLAAAKLPAWITAHVKNVRIAGILTRLEQLSMLVVQEVEQTVVSKLGATPTVDQLKAARDAAIATLKSHLGAQGLQDIETVLGLQDQDAVLKILLSFVESSVHTLRTSGKVAS